MTIVWAGARVRARQAAGDWTGIQVGGSGSIDLEGSEIDYAQTGVGGQTSGSVVVKSDHFASSVPAVAISAPTPTVANNSAVDSPGPNSPCQGCVMATFNVGSSSLNLGLLGGNTASGSGVGGIEVSGTAVTSTFPGGSLPLVIPSFSGGYGAEPGLDVPSGVTATFAAGTVVKGTGTWAPGPWNGGLTVEGSLSAVGASGSPVTFTSINDNSVGGSTGSGSPAAGDWTGIEATGNVDSEYDDIKYAVDGLNLQASPGINDAVHNDWFDQNKAALYGTSDWDGVDTGLPKGGCQYIPEIAAGGNVYGPNRTSYAYESNDDYAAIQSALLDGATAYPDGWTDFSNIRPGDTDHVTWALLPCQVGQDTQFRVASPFDIVAG